ncbi:pentapeptide repeat-containing protein [uncultured Rothia sp.]|uniref:pentapeptide repeat-containing protein n=1 Tax=uncultured Rothia sp. TaxID=316088 RepID=UPI0028DCEAF6|nr:pentapeptide repeat-containing protein [uncultured Rothia sp.]
MPSNNASSAPDNQVTPKAQENPWYIQHFIKLLVGFGLGGGAAAILLPWFLWLHCGMSSGSSDQLRLHLLYVTGGIIAVLTLLQTNWKNQGDRLKIDADIKKNEQDSEKNERDHIRQVHAERRSRYTKAVEQLADEKATVRLGGIYTLVGLVDEWLADDTLDPEEQQKEGQVIINNLCSYIRSPFPLAEKIDEYEARQELKELESKKPDTLLPDESPKLDTLRKRFEDSAEYQEPDNIAALQAAFHEEQDVRRAIFEEMSKRSSKVSMAKNKKVTVTPGTWSTFGFDFSRAPIFYPLNNLTIEQGNFVSARFYGEADFGGAKFSGTANFRDAKFVGNANFENAKFAEAADFSGAEFTGLAYFDYAEFAGAADFNNAKFTGNANFEDAMFAGVADFGGAKFAGAAYFGDAEFAGAADFDGAEFARAAGFGNATFTENAYFSSAEFTEDAYFRGAKFSGKTSFEEAYFEKCAPIFADASNSARFSAQVDPQDYLFEEHPKSPHSFSCGEAELLNRTFILPIGTVLYDPDSWDEEEQDYTRLSEPAK